MIVMPLLVGNSARLALIAIWKAILSRGLRKAMLLPSGIRLFLSVLLPFLQHNARTSHQTYAGACYNANTSYLAELCQQDVFHVSLSAWLYDQAHAETQ